MSKLFAIATALKGTLIVASTGLARGEILPVILISALFSLAELGTKSAGQAVQQGAAVVSQNRDGDR
jgi:hypothetical protein